MSGQGARNEDRFPDEYPPDKQFGEAAAEKEELLDEAIAAGDEDRLPAEPQATQPRPGSKAPPSE